MKSKYYPKLKRASTALKIKLISEIKGNQPKEKSDNLKSRILNMEEIRENVLISFGINH